MGVLLDGDAQDIPSEELEGDVPLLGHVKQRHRVDDLIFGHHQIDDSEILFETVADENDALTDEIAELQVARFQRRQMLAGNVGVQITRLDARKLRQIVYHLKKMGGREKWRKRLKILRWKNNVKVEGRKK